MHRAIEAVDGLYIVPARADPHEVRSEILARGIKAVEVQGKDLEFVRGVPLEFLMMNDADSVEAISTLRELRGLHLGSWSGPLDFDALPLLEWFGTVETGYGQLEPLLQRERKVLHHLAVGRYRFPDVTPLRSLMELTHLAIGDSRAFASMHGIAALPRLRHFSAYMCPKLESLSGLEAAVGLQHVELQSCSRITDLSPLARLEALRSIRIDMRAPPSLAPLIGHPALEFIWIVSAKQQAPEVVDAVLESPRLRFVANGRRAWLRTGGDWEHVRDIYAMSETQTAMYERLVHDRTAAAAW